MPSQVPAALVLGVLLATAAGRDDGASGTAGSHHPRSGMHKIAGTENRAEVHVGIHQPHDNPSTGIHEAAGKENRPQTNAGIHSSNDKLTKGGHKTAGTKNLPRVHMGIHRFNDKLTKGIHKTAGMENRPETHMGIHHLNNNPSTGMRKLIGTENRSEVYMGIHPHHNNPSTGIHRAACTGKRTEIHTKSHNPHDNQRTGMCKVTRPENQPQVHPEIHHFHDNSIKETRKAVGTETRPQTLRAADAGQHLHGSMRVEKKLKSIGTSWKVNNNKYRLQNYNSTHANHRMHNAHVKWMSKAIRSASAKDHLHDNTGADAEYHSGRCNTVHGGQPLIDTVTDYTPKKRRVTHTATRLLGYTNTVAEFQSKTKSAGLVDLLLEEFRPEKFRTVHTNPPLRDNIRPNVEYTSEERNTDHGVHSTRNPDPEGQYNQKPGSLDPHSRDEIDLAAEIQSKTHSTVLKDITVVSDTDFRPRMDSSRGTDSFIQTNTDVSHSGVEHKSKTSGHADSSSNSLNKAAFLISGAENKRENRSYLQERRGRNTKHAQNCLDTTLPSNAVLPLKTLMASSSDNGPRYKRESIINITLLPTSRSSSTFGYSQANTLPVTAGLQVTPSNTIVSINRTVAASNTSISNLENQEADQSTDQEHHIFAAPTTTLSSLMNPTSSVTKTKYVEKHEYVPTSPSFIFQGQENRVQPPQLVSTVILPQDGYSRALQILLAPLHIPVHLVQSNTSKYNFQTTSSELRFFPTTETVHNHPFTSSLYSINTTSEPSIVQETGETLRLGLGAINNITRPYSFTTALSLRSSVSESSRVQESSVIELSPPTPATHSTVTNNSTDQTVEVSSFSLHEPQPTHPNSTPQIYYPAVFHSKSTVAPETSISTTLHYKITLLHQSATTPMSTSITVAQPKTTLLPVSWDIAETHTISPQNSVGILPSTTEPASTSQTMTQETSSMLVTDKIRLTGSFPSTKETPKYAMEMFNHSSSTDTIRPYYLTETQKSSSIRQHSTSQPTESIFQSSSVSLFPSTEPASTSNPIQQPLRPSFRTPTLSPENISLRVQTTAAPERKRPVLKATPPVHSMPITRRAESIREDQDTPEIRLQSSKIPMFLDDVTMETDATVSPNKSLWRSEIVAPVQLQADPASAEPSDTWSSNNSNDPTPVPYVAPAETEAPPLTPAADADNNSVTAREALLTLFKSRYPVQLWRTNGYFTDGFFHLVDNLWLQHEPPNPGAHYALAACYCIIMIIGVFGNSLVIYMFIRCRSLRTPANILVWNLAVSDLFLLLNLVLFIFNSVNLGPALGELGCQVYGFVGALTGTVSIMTLALIAVDRYNVIVYPLEPLRKTSSKSARVFVIGVWLYGALFSVLPLCDVGIRPYVPEGYLTSCTFDYLVQDRLNYIYIISFFFAAWVLPLATICFCYVGICHAVLRTRKVACSAESQRHCRKEEKRSSELRLAGVVIIIVGLWFVSWTPYAVVSLLGITGNHHLITPLSSMAPAVFCKTASCIDPFVYAVTHPRFRKELLALTGLRPQSTVHSMRRDGTEPEPESVHERRRTSETSVQEELVMVDIRDTNSSCGSSPDLQSPHSGKKNRRRSSQRITWTPDMPYLPFTDSVRKQLQPPSWFVPPRPRTDRSTSLRLKDIPQPSESQPITI